MSEFLFLFLSCFFSSIETYYDKQMNSTGVLSSLSFDEPNYFLFYNIINLFWDYLEISSIPFNLLQ